MSTPPTTDSSRTARPRIAIGLMLGPAVGVLLAWLFSFSITIGIGFGMGFGALAGVVFDPKQPRRTRWVVAGFALFLAAAIVLLRVLR